MAVVPDPAAEAARYALLRRLAPSFRHHLVVNLQPIGMICEVMDRRLRASVPDLAQLQDSAGKISAFSRAALHSSTEVIGWVSPDDNVSTSVQECLRECSTLLATSLSFRGYALRNEAAELEGAVRRAALRTLLTGTLLFATDHLPAPAELVLTATSEPDAALVTLEVRTTQSDNHFRGELNYRKVEWPDVQALAAADGVRVSRDGNRFELRFAWLPQA
jgi:hypothetical protein